MLPGGTKRRRRARIPIPKSTFTTYMDEGLMHLKKMTYRKAKYCFDRALEMAPEDVLALICRSQCNLNMGFHEDALRDAEKSMEINEHFVPGLLQLGEVLFTMGWFERALIYYHQGRRNRKNAPEFKIGIMKAEYAIETCILGTSIPCLFFYMNHCTLMDHGFNEQTGRPRRLRTSKTCYH